MVKTTLYYNSYLSNDCHFSILTTNCIDDWSSRTALSHMCSITTGTDAIDSIFKPEDSLSLETPTRSLSEA